MTTGERSQAGRSPVCFGISGNESPGLTLSPMQIEQVFPYRVEYSQLTSVQYDAAKQYCVDNSVAYEDYSGDNRTDMLRTVQATGEQTAALQAVLS